MSMLGEITHLQTLTDDLKTLTMDPHKLPASSEQVRRSEQNLDCSGSVCSSVLFSSVTDGADPFTAHLRTDQLYRHADFMDFPS